MKLLLMPFSAIFAIVVGVRNALFSSGLVRSQSFKVPIISVGNISAGGTGKTPFLIYLVEQLLTRGFKVGVVSRGYRGNYTGVIEVESQKAWTLYGDEPTMIKNRFPDVPVFLSKKRVEAVQALLKNYSVDFILADDAFQHRHLKRNLDLVLLDCTQDRSDYHLLPQGRLREPFGSLQRADWLIFTKQNLVKEEDKERCIEYLLSKAPSNSLSIFADLKPTGLIDINHQEYPVEKLKRVLLLSGIGRPMAFQSSVENFLKRPTDKHWAYADHFCFSETILEQIFSELNPEDVVITTEKDFVRLKSFTNFKNRILIFRVEMQPRGSVDEFWSQINSLAL